MQFKVIVWDWLGTLVTNGTPRHGASDLLYQLHHKGISQVVLTNGHSKYIDLHALSWDKWITSVTGHECGYRKPDKRALLYALNAINALPGRDVLIIGDSLSDKLCAENADCQGLLLSHRCLSQVFDYFDLPLIAR